MSRLEELELTYHVVEMGDQRYKVVLRWQFDQASDRVVADKLTERGANQLRAKLALGGLEPDDIRRLHDYGARRQRDEPDYLIIY